MERMVKKLQVLSPKWLADYLAWITEKTNMSTSDLVRLYMQIGILWWTHYLNDDLCAPDQCAMVKMFEGFADMSTEDFRNLTVHRDDLMILMDEVSFKARTIVAKRMKK